MWTAMARVTMWTTASELSMPVASAMVRARSMRAVAQESLLVTAIATEMN
jgi:hypothetical protein